jgi:hypothetical protein
MINVIPLTDMDYAFKLNAINLLLLYDEHFKNDLSDDIVNGCISMYENTIKPFRELNYTQEEIKDIFKRGLSNGYLAFEKITYNGKLTQLYELNPLDLIPGSKFNNGITERFWKNESTGIHYADEQILHISFEYFFSYLSSKYDTLNRLGERPSISEHLTKLEREHKINQLVDDTIE